MKEDTSSFCICFSQIAGLIDLHFMKRQLRGAYWL